MSQSEQASLEVAPTESGQAQGQEQQPQKEVRTFFRQGNGTFNVSRRGPNDHWTKAREDREVIDADVERTMLRNPSRRQTESTAELFGSNRSGAARTILVAEVTWGYAPLYNAARRHWVRTLRRVNMIYQLTENVPNGPLSEFERREVYDALHGNLADARQFVREQHAQDAKRLESELGAVKESGIKLAAKPMAKITEEYPFEYPISQQALLLLKEIDAWADTRAQLYATGALGPHSVMSTSVKRRLLGPFYQHVNFVTELYEKVIASSTALSAARRASAAKGEVELAAPRQEKPGVDETMSPVQQLGNPSEDTSELPLDISVQAA